MGYSYLYVRSYLQSPVNKLFPFRKSLLFSPPVQRTRPRYIPDVGETPPKAIQIKGENQPWRNLFAVGRVLPARRTSQLR